MKMRVYEYDLKTSNGKKYKGSFTLKDGVDVHKVEKQLNIKCKQVQVFNM